MQDCNSSPTPDSTTPLHTDQDGELFSETWGYPAIVGMLIYQAKNSRPDMLFVVHQCTRFTHAPKASHATAIKRILCYLKGTHDKGMTLSPTENSDINCYIDADCARIWL